MVACSNLVREFKGSGPRQPTGLGQPRKATTIANSSYHKLTFAIAQVHREVHDCFQVDHAHVPTLTCLLFRSILAQLESQRSNQHQGSSTLHPAASIPASAQSPPVRAMPGPPRHLRARHTYLHAAAAALGTDRGWRDALLQPAIQLHGDCVGLCGRHHLGCNTGSQMRHLQKAASTK